MSYLTRGAAGPDSEEEDEEEELQLIADDDRSDDGGDNQAGLGRLQAVSSFSDSEGGRRRPQALNFDEFDEARAPTGRNHRSDTDETPAQGIMGYSEPTVIPSPDFHDDGAWAGPPDRLKPSPADSSSSSGRPDGVGEPGKSPQTGSIFGRFTGEKKAREPILKEEPEEESYDLPPTPLDQDLIAELTAMHAPTPEGTPRMISLSADPSNAQVQTSRRGLFSGFRGGAEKKAKDAAGKARGKGKPGKEQRADEPRVKGSIAEEAPDRNEEAPSQEAPSNDDRVYDQKKKGTPARNLPKTSLKDEPNHSPEEFRQDFARNQIVPPPPFREDSDNVEPNSPGSPRSPRSPPISDPSSRPKGELRNRKGKPKTKGAGKSNRPQEPLSKKFLRGNSTALLPYVYRCARFASGLPEAYVRNVPARCPLVCVVTSFIITFAFVGVGMALKAPTVETELGSLMQTDVNGSITYDAYLAALDGQKVASSRRLQADRNLQSIVAYFEAKVMIAYELKPDSHVTSLLDLEALLKIAAFESKMRSLPGWQRMCGTSLTMFSYFCTHGISLASYMLPTKEVAQNSVLPRSLKLNGAGQDPIPFAAVQQLLQAHNIVEVVLPNDYDPSAPQSAVSVFRSLFVFRMSVGTDQTSTGAMQGVQAQLQKDYEKFIEDALLEFLQEEPKKDKNFPARVFFQGDYLERAEVIQTLMKDLKLAIGSIIFVFLYLMVHTGHPLSSILGLLIISLSAPVAYVIFAIIADSTTMALANFLAVFLVVGLGADVIFVYTDGWSDSVNLKEDRARRMMWVYRHAGKASLATTFTTSLSFFANLASVLKPLRDFGMFMGLCVVAVWVLASVIYVPICVLTERHCRRCRIRLKRKSEADASVTRAAIFNAWTHRLNNWRWTCSLSCSIFGITAIVLAAVNMESDLSLPNIFPSGHNQNKGKDILENQFKPYSQLPLAQDVMSWPVPTTTVDICREWNYLTPASCALFWCSSDQMSLTGGQCACYTKYSTTCSAASGSATANIYQRFIGLNGVTNAQLTTAATNFDGDGQLGPLQTATVHTRTHIVLERWVTGAVSLQPVIDVFGQSARNFNSSPCALESLCFCGASTSRCVQQGTLWTFNSSNYLTPTNLQSIRRLQLLQPSEVTVPIQSRAAISVVFGISVEKSRRWFGERESTDMWDYQASFDAAHPRVQRDMHRLCSGVPKELRIAEMECWIEDFRRWLPTKSYKFPAPASVFHSLVAEFGNGLSYGTIQKFNRAFMWLKQGRLKASFVQFYVDVNKNAETDVALDYMKRWDKYLQAWNEEASPPAYGAFHTSKLWQEAETRHELIRSTITTLVILVLLSFVSMLIFTQDLAVSCYVVGSTIWVVCGLFFFMTCICRWRVGPIESIALIVFIGYALTYSLHIGHKYADYDVSLDSDQDFFQASQRGERDVELATGGASREAADSTAADERRRQRILRTAFALRYMGGTVLGSAATTVGCTTFLLFCTLTIFQKFGAVVLVVTLLSVTASLAPLPAILLLAGPLKSGRLCTQVRGCLTCSHSLPKPSISLPTVKRRNSPREKDGAAENTPAEEAGGDMFMDGIMQDEAPDAMPSIWETQLPGAEGLCLGPGDMFGAGSRMSPMMAAPLSERDAVGPGSRMSPMMAAPLSAGDAVGPGSRMSPSVSPLSAGDSFGAGPRMPPSAPPLSAGDTIGAGSRVSLASTGELSGSPLASPRTSHGSARSSARSRPPRAPLFAAGAASPPTERTLSPPTSRPITPGNAATSREGTNRESTNRSLATL